MVQVAILTPPRAPVTRLSIEVVVAAFCAKPCAAHLFERGGFKYRVKIEFSHLVVVNFNRIHNGSPATPASLSRPTDRPYSRGFQGSSNLLAIRFTR